MPSGSDKSDFARWSIRRDERRKDIAPLFMLANMNGITAGSCCRRLRMATGATVRVQRRTETVSDVFGVHELLSACEIPFSWSVLQRGSPAPGAPARMPDPERGRRVAVTEKSVLDQKESATVARGTAAELKDGRRERRDANERSRMLPSDSVA